MQNILFPFSIVKEHCTPSIDSNGNIVSLYSLNDVTIKSGETICLNLGVSFINNHGTNININEKLENNIIRLELLPQFLLKGLSGGNFIDINSFSHFIDNELCIIIHNFSKPDNHYGDIAYVGLKNSEITIKKGEKVANLFLVPISSIV